MNVVQNDCSRFKIMRLYSLQQWRVVVDKVYGTIGRGQRTAWIWCGIGL